MCAPVAGLIQGGIGAMSAIAGYNAKVADFNAQEAAWKTNYVNSLAAGRNDEQQLTVKAEENQGVLVQKENEYAVEGAQKAAAAETAAAGAGVGGNSVDDIVRGILGGAARNRYYAQVNFNNKATELAQEQKGTVTTEESRINSVTRPNAPNAGELFLGVGGAILGGIGGSM